MIDSLKEALVDALDDLAGGVGGTIDEADLVEQVGATTVGHIVEASDLTGPDQASAYLVLCDLLSTRLSQGIDQVLGCLVFDTEPDAAALVPALKAMNGENGFTPVLPLSRWQATVLVRADADVDTFSVNATLLLGVAADHRSPGLGTATTFLMELAELVENHVGAA